MTYLSKPLARVALRASSVVLAGVATLSLTPRAEAQEPAACLNPDPKVWPAPSRPYFMLAVDTSGSMTACTNPTTVYPNKCPVGATPNSCSLTPTRYNDAKCAVQKTIQAYAGEVNFGLATYAVEINGCPANCTSQCTSGNAADCAPAPVANCCLADAF